MVILMLLLLPAGDDDDINDNYRMTLINDVKYNAYCRPAGGTSRSSLATGIFINETESTGIRDVDEGGEGRLRVKL